MLHLSGRKLPDKAHALLQTVFALKVHQKVRKKCHLLLYDVSNF